MDKLQKEQLDDAKEVLEKLFAEYREKFSATVECEGKVRKAVERYKKERIQFFLNRLRDSGFGLCTVSKSKECERVIPIDALEYVYLRKTEEVKDPLTKLLSPNKDRGKSLFRTGIYVVCSECLRSILPTKRVFLEDGYFVALPP